MARKSDLDDDLLDAEVSRIMKQVAKENLANQPIADAITRVVFEGAEIRDGMAEVLKALNKRYRHPIWAKLAKLDYSRDKARIRRWLRDVLRKEPPPKSINAILFGIGMFSETEESEVYYDLVLLGAKRFNPKAEEPADFNEYAPERGIFGSKVLPDISAYLFNARKRPKNIKEHAIDSAAEAYASLLVVHLCNLCAEDLLGDATKRYVLCGYPEAEGLLGYVSASGWQPLKDS